MNRVYVGIFLALSIVATGCASAGLNSGGDRALEYQQLKENIQRYHAQSLFGPGQPWLFSSDAPESIFRRFSANYCRTGKLTEPPVPSDECKQQFGAMIQSMLVQTYFAADPAQVTENCSREPLVCGDVQAIEVLFRNLHNQGVKESEREKLAKIDEWRDRKLTDDQLKDALHVQFKFEDGKLNLTVPGDGLSAQM